jgi:hypothetical protein
MGLLCGEVVGGHSVFASKHGVELKTLGHSKYGIYVNIKFDILEH